MTREDRIKEILNRVLDVFSVSEAFTGRVKELQQAGTEMKGLCPFHNDSHVGSFLGSDYKGVWKCFSCGCGGNAISFVRDYERLHGSDVNYVEIGLKIAKEKAIITNEEYESLTRRKISNSYSSEIEKIYKYKNKEEIADVDTLDKVYSIFSKGNEYLGKERLSEEHKSHLLNHRHLTEDEIKEVGYFTFPKGFATRKILKTLEENEIPVDTLKKVPGFFYDKTTERYTFTTYSSAIGIPIRNKDGKIVAIQVRKDTVKEKDNRYIWFSSAWVQGKKDKLYGCSCGAPINVIYPKDKRTSAIYITEGHFKAIQIANKFGAIAISVQGVSTWKSVLPVLKEIPHSHICIAYDADMAYNDGVFLQAIKMGITMLNLPEFVKHQKTLENLGRKGVEQESIMKELYEILYQEYMENHKIRPKNKCLTVKYVLWDSDKGKGIDDFLEMHSVEELKFMNIAMFYSKYVQYLRKINQFYEKHEDEKIPEEKRKEWFNSIMF